MESVLSMLLKTIVSALIYLVFIIIFIFIAYNFNLLAGSLVTGLSCGFVIALITRYDTFIKTALTRFIAVIFIFITHFLFEISGIPYSIIMYIFRNDIVIKEIGHLTINEKITYGWGRFLFFGVLIFGFFISAVCFQNSQKNIKNT